MLRTDAADHVTGLLVAGLESLLLEIIEHRSKHGSTIFCTQYETAGWYERINPDPEQDSPIADAIMDRIINNAYVVSVDGKISMRERHGIKASANRKAGE